MRNLKPLQKFVTSLFCGLGFFAFAQVAMAADDSQETIQQKYQRIAEECITQTERTLEEKGIIPSEESSEYDTKFDEAYKGCMAAKGMPDEPAGGVPATDEDVPSDAPQKLDTK